MRRLKKITLICAVGLLVIMVGLYLYVFILGGLERIVNKQVASLVRPENKLQVSVGNIKGNIFSGITLERVEAFYVDSTHRYCLARVPRLTAAYSLSNIWNKNYILDYLHIDSACVMLARDTSGNWLLPDFSSGGTSERPRFVPALTVGELRLNSVSLSLIDPADTLAFDNITLAASIKTEDDTYGASIDRFEFTSNEERIVLDAAEGQLTYSNGNVVFQGVTVVSADTRVKLNGSVGFGREPRGDIEFAVDNLDLEDITSYIGPRLRGVLDLNGAVSFDGKTIRGKVDMGGTFMLADFRNLHAEFRFAEALLYLDTLYGSILSDCAIDGKGEIDFSEPAKKYRLNADIKNFNLKNLVHRGFPSNLSGRIALEGQSFRTHSMLLKVHTDFYESSFHEYPIQKGTGDLVITADSMFFLDGFTVDYYENVFTATGRIDYSGSIDLDVAAQLGNLDRYRGKLFIDKPGGRGYARARLSGLTADPDLTGYFESDSVWIYGLYSDSMYATFDLRRFLTGRRGNVEATCYSGAAWEIPYDSAYTRLLVDSNLIGIDTVAFCAEYSKVCAQGILDVEAYPKELRLDTLTVTVFDQEFKNHEEAYVEIDSAGFDFKQVTIGNNGARLSLLGKIGYDESMNARLSVDHVPAGPWIGLFRPDWSVDGIVSCEASLRGTFMKPEFDLTGFVDSLMYRNLILGHVGTNVNYSNRLLTIDSLNVRSDSGQYQASGALYADVAFTTDSLERFPDLPMNIRITARDRRFDLVSLVMPSVEQLDGDFVADVTLTGTPFDPHLEGGAHIKNARLKYFDLEQLLYSDSAAVSMEDNRIVVQEIEIHTRDRKASAYVEGEIVVKTFDSLYYDLDVSLPREFPFAYELDDIKGVVEGDVHIEGDTPPLVTGDLTLISTRYEVNFAEADEGSPVMAALSGENTWDLNIIIDILSNYWIKNDDIDAELSGQVNLIRDKGQYRFIGEMEILRGKGFLFDKTFQLEPGSRVIFEGNETLNPRLDVKGYTRVTVATPAVVDEERTYDQINACVHITGTLETPEINPCEDSDVQNREELLLLIVANQYTSEKGSASTSVERRVTGLISSQVSQIGTRQLGQLGVETFEIDPYDEGGIDLAKTRVTLGFYTPVANLYVYGRSALSGQTGQEVGFEYRFAKNVIFQGRRDEEELYRLLLKLHWEFE